MFFTKKYKKNKKESEGSQPSQLWKKLLNQELATLPWLLTPLFHQQLCVHPPQQHPERGGKNPRQKLTCWNDTGMETTQPVWKMTCFTQVTLGMSLQVFQRKDSTNNVGWSWILFLRTAHHCYIFSTIKPTITCCSWTMLFWCSLKEIKLHIFKLLTLKSHSSRTGKIISYQSTSP